MTKYHYSPLTGQMEICKAKGPCPLGGEHFDNPESQEAQMYADTRNEELYKEEINKQYSMKRMFNMMSESELSSYIQNENISDEEQRLLVESGRYPKAEREMLENNIGLEYLVNSKSSYVRKVAKEKLKDNNSSNAQKEMSTKKDYSNVELATEDEIQRYDNQMQHSAPVNDGDSEPMNNLVDTFPDDYIDHPKWYGAKYKETMESIKRAKDNPNAMIKIYRVVPKDVNTIRPGDWIALSEEYAYDNGYDFENEHIITSEIPARVIYNNGDSLEEWGYSGKESLEGEISRKDL